MRIVLALYTLLIIVLSLIPGPDLPDVHLSDKASHLLAYAGLSALLVAAINLRRVSAQSLVLALLMANVLGIGLELIQPISGRSRDVYDMLANFAGSLIGLGIGSAVVLMLGVLFPTLSRQIIERNPITPSFKADSF